MKGSIEAVAKTIIDRVYPVGIIVDFAVEADPNVAIGCGTVWTRMADGRTLIASDVNHPTGWMGGEAQHALTEAELPRHLHAFPPERYLMAWGSAAKSFGDIISTSGWGSAVLYTKEQWGVDGANTRNQMAADQAMPNTQETGGSLSHNNMQPSLAVSRWRRTA
ncbi:MAG: hypothetical protein U0J65_05650 [Christensenellales bacterium]|nr:hypothetical protein [Christensenellales bacterium]